MDISNIYFRCASFDQVPRTLGEIGDLLDPQSAQQLKEIVKSYIASYGFMGVYERLNGRSVGQIFAEYQHVDKKPIASGQIDGLHYELHERAAPKSANGCPGDIGQ